MLVAVVNRYGDGLDPDPEMSGAGDAVGVADTTHFRVTPKPVIATDEDIRCQGQQAQRDGSHKLCNKLLAKMASRPWQIMCPRCRTMNTSPEST